MKGRVNLLEQLADLEHIQWWVWAADISATENISAKRASRWGSLFVPYKALPEDAQEQDKAWARKVLQIIEPLVDSLEAENKRLRAALEAWKTAAEAYRELHECESWEYTEAKYDEAQSCFGLAGRLTAEAEALTEALKEGKP